MFVTIRPHSPDEVSAKLVAMKAKIDLDPQSALWVVSGNSTNAAPITVELRYKKGKNSRF
jgi:hypothetical protein